MSYEFKKLSEVEAMTEVPEGAKVLAEANGKIVRVPATVGGGSGSEIPKPLTYDYMPEGYPSKAYENVTLIEEQSVVLQDAGHFRMAFVEKSLVFEEGKTYTVYLDGVEYTSVAKINNSGSVYIGNETLDPFIVGPEDSRFLIATTSTSSSITFKIVGPSVAYTPMDANFLPCHKHYKKVSTKNTYDEIMAMIESGILPYIILSNDFYCATLYLSSYNKSGEKITFTSYPFYNSMNEKADIYKYELERNGSWVFKTLSFSATETTN